MMNLIDRYIFAVTEHLPEDMREDVGRELRTNIEDMLPQNPEKGDVYRVLEELGNPWKLASEYNPKKRYLIGPGLYDNYLSVLKLVTGVVTAVLVAITLISWIFNLSVDTYLFENIIESFVEVLVIAIQGAIQAALWVTLVFAVLERTGVGEGVIPFSKKNWSPDDLPVLPINDKRKISRGETVFSMFGTVLFTALLYFRPQLLALYIKDEFANINITPLFDTERLQSYIPIIILFAVIQLGIFIWKYIARRWNISLAVANLIYNLSLCILLLIMINDNSLFNGQFFIEISNYTKMAFSEIMAIWERVIVVFTVVFIAINIWDGISKFSYCKE